jgi:cyclomaltodextrinase / maltogenic alpha-amylase / neopullulanase
MTHYHLRDLIMRYAFHGFGSEDIAFDLQQLLEDTGEAAPWMLASLGSHDTPRVWRERDLARLKIALVLQMPLPGSPVVYYGDEIQMVGGAGPDNRRTIPWSPEM